MKTANGLVGVSKIKRCYVDIMIDEVCPVCKNLVYCDLNHNYLSHPVVGEVDHLYFMCDYCDTEFTVPMTVKTVTMEIEYDPDLKEIEFKGEWNHGT